MRIIFFVSIILLFPVYAAAQKVAVVPASFLKTDTGAESIDAAAQITERVLEGVRDAGREPSNETAVKNAIVQVAGKKDGVCQDKECLSRLADLLYADEAIFVRVVEKSEAEREVILVLGRGEGTTETREDGFMVVLEQIRRKVALALQKSEPRDKDGAMNVEPEKEPEQELKEEKPREGILPLGFYVSAGVTSALAISWAVMESVGFSRKKDLENRVEDDTWESDRDSLKNLQIADWVVFGAAVTGAITTAVLFIFTDFDNERTGEARLALSKNRRAPANDRRALRVKPAITENGGALMIEGTF